MFTVAVLITTCRINRTIDSSPASNMRTEIYRRPPGRDESGRGLNEQLERVFGSAPRSWSSAARLRAEIESANRRKRSCASPKLESLGVLAGGIAHDFNNFLTVIQGNVEIARQSLDLGSPVQEVLEETSGVASARHSCRHSY